MKIAAIKHSNGFNLLALQNQAERNGGKFEGYMRSSGYSYLADFNTATSQLRVFNGKFESLPIKFKSWRHCLRSILHAKTHIEIGL